MYSSTTLRYLFTTQGWLFSPSCRLSQENACSISTLTSATTASGRSHSNQGAIRPLALGKTITVMSSMTLLVIYVVLLMKFVPPDIFARSSVNVGSRHFTLEHLESWTIDTQTLGQSMSCQCPISSADIRTWQYWCSLQAVANVAWSSGSHWCQGNLTCGTIYELIPFSLCKSVHGSVLIFVLPASFPFQSQQSGSHHSLGVFTLACPIHHP